MQVMEKQPLCSCNRGEQVMYCCLIDSCPNRVKQPQYCMLCDDDQPSAHEHKGKKIALQNSSIENQWLQLRKDVNSKVTKVNDW